MINKVPALLLAATSIALIYFAASFGAASLYGSAIEQTQIRWKEQGTISPPSEEEIQNSEKLIDALLEIQPNHPYYLSLAASHYAWLSFLHQDPELLTHSINFESQALQNRPIWSQSYSQLARYAWQKQLGSNQINTYLQHAEQFGPHSPYSSEAYLEIGLANWTQLHSPQQIKVARILLQHSTSSKYRAEVENIITRSPAKQRACNLLHFNNITLHACNNLL
ncbi:hypothetical protein MHO82_16655 [Vibrio sp. Of7-15]|uniref:hypothetical protein n=1 Tax=Vibrio sp. Of7-15 TaxID=2724879 RepID=UPI001EF20BE1|nr:hypothetical protein [Vibrio sp. Of7-15]MCG7498500.1 hypothetical protein [Vibrio sp. Of7-15]